MSRRQSERASRFEAEIENGVRRAAVAFRDNDVETSVGVAVRLWWTSHLRGRRFAELVRQAYDVTQARISLGAIERGDAGRREAMPYFLAVLCDLVIHDGAREVQGGRRHTSEPVGPNAGKGEPVSPAQHGARDKHSRNVPRVAPSCWRFRG